MSKPFSRSICWLRRDLRLEDHTALATATEDSSVCYVVFIFDRCILDELVDSDDRRVAFIHRSLTELDQKLIAMGSGLIVRVGDPTIEIPRLAEELGVDAVVTARDYEPYAFHRDRTVQERLQTTGVRFETVQDHVLIEPNLVSGPNGAYRVYSPYARAWRAQYSVETHAQTRTLNPENLAPTNDLTNLSHPWTMADIGFVPSEPTIAPGEDAAKSALRLFEERMANYALRRDFPAEPATSQLSPHLRFGTISIRELARRAHAVGGKGAEKWLAELIWREFYISILYHFPNVVDSTFQPEYRDLAYPGDPSHLEAWKSGMTGYPLVDAAMRCLRETGWMHNRLRMVVASFLTKDLLLDYRHGEAHFARYLLDFELASNNGGWQWAAGTGADPQPYFRIFNPVLQSEKFDPAGAFIRQWVPELASVDSPYLHFPSRATPFDLAAAGVTLGDDYPFPIVDHHIQRDLAIALLKGARQEA